MGDCCRVELFICFGQVAQAVGIVAQLSYLSVQGRVAQALGIVYPYGVGEFRLYWAGWFRLYVESVRLGQVGFGNELFFLPGRVSFLDSYDFLWEV